MSKFTHANTNMIPMGLEPLPKKNRREQIVGVVASNGFAYPVQNGFGNDQGFGFANSPNFNFNQGSFGNNQDSFGNNQELGFNNTSNFNQGSFGNNQGFSFSNFSDDNQEKVVMKKKSNASQFRSIPNKKCTHSEFDLKKYIKEKVNDHMKEYTKNFTETATKDFSLLEKLRESFQAHLKSERVGPFRYHIYSSGTSEFGFKLSDLTQIAIDIFKFEIQRKGYDMRIILKQDGHLIVVK